MLNTLSLHCHYTITRGPTWSLHCHCTVTKLLSLHCHYTVTTLLSLHSHYTVNTLLSLHSHYIVTVNCHYTAVTALSLHCHSRGRTCSRTVRTSRSHPRELTPHTSHFKKTLPEHHLNIGLAMSNLAICHRLCERYHRALAQHQEALATF